MAALLNLKRARACKIGEHINVRTEKHGDDNVPACDVPIVGALLDADELDVLLGDGAHAALFAKKRGGDGFAEPRFADLKPLAIKHKFAKSRVAIALNGTDDEVVFDDVTLARLKLEPQQGGLTSVALAVQCTPDSKIMGQLYDHLGAEVRAKIRFGERVERGDDKQDELPLTGAGNGKDDGEDSDDEAGE